MIDSGIDAWRVLGAVKPACWEAAASEGAPGLHYCGPGGRSFLLRRSEGDLRNIWAARRRFSRCVEQPSTREVRPMSRAVAPPKGYRKATTLSTRAVGHP